MTSVIQSLKFRGSDRVLRRKKRKKMKTKEKKKFFARKKENFCSMAGGKETAGAFCETAGAQGLLSCFASLVLKTIQLMKLE